MELEENISNVTYCDINLFTTDLFGNKILDFLDVKLLSY